MTGVRAPGAVQRMKETRLHRWERRLYCGGMVAMVLLAAEHLLSKGSL